MSAIPTVLLLAGSPSEPSRSAALLDAVAQRLQAHQDQTCAAFAVERLRIRDLHAPALVLADWNHSQVVASLAQVANAQLIVVATPVYKAAYSGLLKVFLDLLPQTALAGKTVLPPATGGSPHHMLALDYALRPAACAAVLLADHVILIEDGYIALDQRINLPRPRQPWDVRFVVLERQICSACCSAQATLLQNGQNPWPAGLTQKPTACGGLCKPFFVLNHLLALFPVALLAIYLIAFLTSEVFFMSVQAINIRNQFRVKVKEIICGDVVSEIDVETRGMSSPRLSPPNQSISQSA